jgi:signal peptidase I
LRRLVEAAVVLLSVGLILRTWCLQGLFVPFQVSSGSMAETLLGPHCRIACGDCGFGFVCGTDQPVPGGRAVCPNCGYGRDEWEGSLKLAGDRLLVDKASFLLRTPRRWEVVAFRDPQRPSHVVVKRVAGLPGESIQIRDGDVYVSGQIVRKTLAQQRAMAVPVHDADFSPRLEPTAPPRWQAERNGSRWVAAGGSFTRPEVPGEDAVDWLTYVHRRRIPGGRERTAEAPIVNQCGYNQALPQRSEDLAPATDLMLAFRVVRTSGRGELAVRIADGWAEFEVRVDPQEGRLRVLRNGKPEDAGALDFELPAADFHVEVSTFDRQLLVAVDGRAAALLPYQRSDRPRRATSRPVSIGCRALGVEIRELRVFRDVYYTRPAGGHGRWGLDSPVQLGDDEYFVLGDNSSISEDSRTWPQGPSLSGGLLVGKPLLVHFPAQEARLGGWRFQVPDLARIRYIR